MFESLGRSLYDYLKRNDYRPFPFDLAAAFTRQMLEALEFLHTMDLCHTDLKPENVLCLTVEGEHEADNDAGHRVLVPASPKVKSECSGASRYCADAVQLCGPHRRSPSPAPSHRLRRRDVRHGPQELDREHSAVPRAGGDPRHGVVHAFGLLVVGLHRGRALPGGAAVRHGERGSSSVEPTLFPDPLHAL